MSDKFIKDMQSAYQPQGPSITLGAALLNDAVIADAPIKAPLSMFNRHGLIAGATGTGKTKTIQVFAEQLSKAGVPTILMDLKGDLSGLGAAGTPHPKIDQRHQQINIPYQAQPYPVELLSISSQPGVKCRITVNDFGAILFAKLLDLNATQGGILSILFKFCRDNEVELIDLNDLKQVLRFASEEGQSAIEKDYGKVSTASLGSILRRVVALESQGGDLLFGEPALNINDILQTDLNGRGKINILRLTDIQDKPQLFSTFMISLLSTIYQTFPEMGDVAKPKLVIFIDEAHLIFKDASKVLLNNIESIIKLIRSKGVGIYFCTQTPRDIPASILSQLGLKCQHALRAFTAKDRKDIKLIAENYPQSEYYDTATLLVSLGIGEALLTCLDEKAQPTMLAATRFRAPESRMGVLSDQEIMAINQSSTLCQRYENRIDRASAYEKLDKKLSTSAETPARPTPEKAEDGLIETISKNTLFRRVINTVVREVTRAVLKAMGIKNR